MVGNITRSDILELRTMDEPIIFAFNVKVAPDVEKLSKDNKVTVFHSNIIYTLLESHKRWVFERKTRQEQEVLASIHRPGMVRVIPGYVFRQSRPAVFGVDVVKGIIRSGEVLEKDGKPLGEIKEIQSQGENVQKAEAGEKVALSMMDVVVGKDVQEGDELRVRLTEEDVRKLQGIRHKLRGDELELLQEA